MAITLKEAEEQYPEVIRRKQYEESVEYNRELKAIIKDIDREIILNLDKLKTKPIRFDYPNLSVKLKNDIEKNYSDFTVDYLFRSEAFIVKLADKDWDWGGYGIKTTPRNEVKEDPKPKKTIFNLFGLFN